MNEEKKGRFLNLPHRAKLVVFASAGAAVVIIAMVSVIAMLNNPKPTEELKISDEEAAARDARVKQSKIDGALRDDARAAIRSGDGETADELYTKAIAAEKDTERKVRLYIDQSALLYGTGSPEEAIKVALEAEAITDDKYLTADWLSRLYEDQKMYDKAIEYYNLAGEWADSPTNLAKLDKAYYDNQVKRVKKLEQK